MRAWRSFLIRSTVALVALALAPAATAADTFKVLHAFTWAAQPTGVLARDAAGNLYGTTQFGAGSGCADGRGCGAVWKLSPDSDGSWTATILHVFQGSDGAQPVAGVILDSQGNLYGTTAGGGSTSSVCIANGGNEGCGVVFKLKLNSTGTWTYRILHSFNFSDGAFPYGSLVFDALGNLYGTARSGGTYGGGIVFELTPNASGSWTESVLHDFGGGGADGQNPLGGLTRDAHGNLYGSTYEGGSSGSCPLDVGCGTVFELTPGSGGNWIEQVLYTFNGHADGGFPQSSLTLDSRGRLYGTGSTVVFEVTPNLDGTWSETVLHTFPPPSPVHDDGSYPYAGVSFDSAGNLYGTTAQGGCAGYGVVYELSPTSEGWTETIVHTFYGVGSNPDSPPLFDPAGNLYGTTSGGSLVFEITP